MEMPKVSSGAVSQKHGGRGCGDGYARNSEYPHEQCTIRFYEAIETEGTYTECKEQDQSDRH